MLSEMTVITYHFDNTHSNWSEVKSLCGFNFYFPDDCEFFSYAYWASVCLF
jgi:hypothetical protein